MMEILKIVGLSIGAIITLFILTKIMGNKEMSQLNMFDYIIGITIGSIAAEMSTSLEDNFVQPFTAMIAYALITVLISTLTSHSLKARRIVDRDIQSAKSRNYMFFLKKKSKGQGGHELSSRLFDYFLSKKHIIPAFGYKVLICLDIY